LLDDHRENYGIYRMDVDADLDDSVGPSSKASPRRLPRPAIIRLEVPGTYPQFVAEGSSIIGTSCFPRSYWSMEIDEDDGSTVAYDIETATLSIRTTHCGLPKTPFLDLDMACSQWTSSYDELPFGVYSIQAHAVHPRERTIFVSAPVDIFQDFVNTLSYDPTTYEWMHRGTSALPFKGHAVYDGELDAWLGFHVDDRGDRTGHLVACRVPSPVQDWPPHSKVMGEKMLVEDPGWRCVDAKLVHMVERGEYCLVERLRRQGTDERERLRDGDECLLRLTTFRVGVGHYGLRITDNRRTGSYKVCRYRMGFQVGAYWM
jgi:hypothetical protein